MNKLQKQIHTSTCTELAIAGHEDVATWFCQLDDYEQFEFFAEVGKQLAERKQEPQWESIGQRLALGMTLGDKACIAAAEMIRKIANDIGSNMPLFDRCTKLH
jgi:hypothetical protein